MKPLLRTSGFLRRSPLLPDVELTEADSDNLPEVPIRTPIRCWFGFHDLGKSGVGHCRRGCGYFKLNRMLAGGGWIKATAPPKGDPPRGMPPRNPPSPPPPGPPEPPRPPLHRPVS